MTMPTSPDADKAITIIDVARIAGVSIKTVSRVINRETGVGADTRTHVENVIRELDYRPNASARALSSHRKYLIGMIVASIGQFEYVGQLQAGVTESCLRAGYHLTVESPPPEGEARRAWLARLQSRRAFDGLVISPPLSDDEELIDFLINANIPIVRIAPADKSNLTPYVFTDDYEASYQITSRICELGHRLIAMIEGPEDHVSARERRRGFNDAMRNHGLIPRDTMRVRGDYGGISGFECTEALLSLTPRPTAIVAANDLMAIGALAAISKHGLRAPEDISVVGFDDIPAASACWPPLTTVRQPIDKLGELASDLLIAGIGDPRHRTDARSAFHPCEIIVRTSLGPPLVRS